MKSLLCTLLLMFLVNNNSFSGKNDSTILLPNVKFDYVENNNFYLDPYYQLCIGGISGVGLNSSYFLPKNLVASAKIGIGIGLGENKYPKGSSYAISMDLRGGYVFFQDVKPRDVMWVIKETPSGYNRMQYEYFNIKSPRHRYLIAELGYTNNPIDNLSGRGYQSLFYAPSLNLGIRWKKITNILVRVVDKDTKDIWSGNHWQSSEFYAGLLIPLKSEILAPNSDISPLQKSNLLGYSIFYKVGISRGRWNVFVRYTDTGYNDNDQITLGASINIGSRHR